MPACASNDSLLPTVPASRRTVSSNRNPHVLHESDVPSRQRSASEPWQPSTWIFTPIVSLCVYDRTTDLTVLGLTALTLTQRK